MLGTGLPQHHLQLFKQGRRAEMPIHSSACHGSQLPSSTNSLCFIVVVVVVVVVVVATDLNPNIFEETDERSSVSHDPTDDTRNDQASTWKYKNKQHSRQHAYCSKHKFWLGSFSRACFISRWLKRRWPSVL